MNGIYYERPHCPRCGSGETRIVATRPKVADVARIRRHKCKKCEHPYKSVERVPGYVRGRAGDVEG